MKPPYQRPFGDPSGVQIPVASAQGATEVTRWKPKHELLQGKAYPFQVSFASASGSTGEVNIAGGWVVRPNFIDNGSRPNSCGQPLQIAGGGPISCDDGDVIYLKVTYSTTGSHEFLGNTGDGHNELTYVDTFVSEDPVPVNGRVEVEVTNAFGSPPTTEYVAESPAPEGTATTFYWPLASVAISSGAMTLTPIFTGGVVPLPVFVVPYSAAPP